MSNDDLSRRPVELIVVAELRSAEEDHVTIEQDLPHVAEPVFAEAGDLRGHRASVRALVVSRGEDVVPEQRHLLSERARSVGQVVDPA